MLPERGGTWTHGSELGGEQRRGWWGGDGLGQEEFHRGGAVEQSVERHEDVVWARLSWSPVEYEAWAGCGWRHASGPVDPADNGGSLRAFG